MSALREILVSFGVTVDMREVEAAQQGVEKLLDSFMRLVKSSAVVLGGKALAGFVEDTIAAANQVGILAARYGATTEATQELMAVSDAAGVHFTQLLHGFRAINTAAEKNASEFHELGINTRQANGQFKSQVDLFWETGEALSKVTNDTHRTYLAQRLLGRAGQQLMPIFQGTKEEIEAFRKKIQETSTVFTDQFIGKARLATFSLQAMGRTWEKLAGIVTEQLLPAFNWTVDKLTELGKWLQDVAKHSDALNSMFAALAIGIGILTVQLGPMLLEILPITLAFAALFFLLEDFVGFLRGNKSVFGELMDQLFGEGGQDKARNAIQSLWDGLKEFVAWISSDSTWVGFTEALNRALRAALGTSLADTLGIKDLRAERLQSQQNNPNQDTVPLPPGMSVGNDSTHGTGVGGTTYAGGEDQAIDEALAPVKAVFSAAADNLSNWLLQGVKPEGANDVGLNSTLPPLDSKGFLYNPALPQPRLPGSQAQDDAIARRAMSDNAPVINNNITVQGNADARTARDIANKTGTATAASLGRGRDAIGAGVGIR